MPDVAQTGIFGLALENARSTLANVIPFQQWVGAATSAAAKGHIALLQDDFEKFSRPYALIYWSGQAGRSWSGQGTGMEFHPWPEGTITIRFVDETAKIHKDNPDAAVAAFLNDVAATMDGMAALSGTGSNLVFSRYSLPDDIDLLQKKDGNSFEGFSIEIPIELPGGGA